MDFSLQLAFHHSKFYEDSTAKIWVSLVPSFTFLTNSDENQKFIVASYSCLYILLYILQLLSSTNLPITDQEDKRDCTY